MMQCCACDDPNLTALNYRKDLM